MNNFATASSPYPLRPSSRLGVPLNGRRTLSVSEELRKSTSKTTVVKITPNPLSSEPVQLLSHLDDSASVAPTAVAHPLPAVALPFVDFGISHVSVRPSFLVQNGFDRLSGAVTKLVERLPEATLDEKFALIGRWIESYQLDVVPNKLRKQLELIMGLAQDDHNADDASDNPTKLSHQISKALVSCFAMHQLLMTLSRLKPVLLPVVEKVTQGIFEAVYSEPPSVVPRHILDVDDKTVFAEDFAHFQRRLHLQDARDSKRKLTSVQHFLLKVDQWQTSQQQAIERVAVHWQIAYKKMAFGAWKTAVSWTKSIEKKDDEVGHLRAEIAALHSRIHQLTDSREATEKKVVELQRHALEAREKAKIAYDALRYDYVSLEMKWDSEISRREQELERGAQRIRELEERIQELQKSEEETKSSSCSLATALIPLHITEIQKSLDACPSVETMVETFSQIILQKFGHTSHVAHCDLLLMTLSIITPKYVEKIQVEETMVLQGVEKVMKTRQILEKHPIYELLNLVSDEQLLSSLPQPRNALMARALMWCMGYTDFVLRSNAFIDINKLPSSMGALQCFGDSVIRWGSKLRELDGYFAAALTDLALADRPLRKVQEVSAKELKQFDIIDLPSMTSKRFKVDEHLPLVRSVVQKRATVVRSVFREYGGVDPNGQTTVLPDVAFPRLIREAGLMNDRVDSLFLRSLFAGPITPKRFLSMIFEVGVQYFPDVSAAEATRLTILRLEQVSSIPRLEKISLMSESTVDLLRIHETELRNFFTKFATEVGNSKLTYADLNKLLSEGKVYDEHLTPSIGQTIFAMLSTTTDKTLSYESFVQAMQLCSNCKFIEPWLSTDHKFRRLLQDVLFPSLTKKVSTRFPMS